MASRHGRGHQERRDAERSLVREMARKNGLDPRDLRATNNNRPAAAGGQGGEKLKPQVGGAISGLLPQPRRRRS